MRILIYGAGAVGLGLASCLLKSKQEVSLMARKDTAHALKKFGLKRRGILGSYKASPKNFSCLTALENLKNQPFDFILVTIKSFDSERAAKDISRHKKVFNKDTKIVLCQNGWGNAEIFAEFFPKKQIYNARVITGFIRPKPNEVTLTVHADSVRMGSLFGGNISLLKPLADAVSKGDLPCRVVKNIEKDLWAKMLYNCALNPLGAIFDCPYGILGESPYTRNLMNEIMREVFCVMKKTGYKTHWSTAKGYMKAFYSKFLPSTYQHHSSTLQDIKAKRKTEIDSLNGMAIRLAEGLKIPIPVNRMVYQMIKLIEQKNLK